MRNHGFVRKKTMGENGHGLSTLFLPIFRVDGRPKGRFYSLSIRQVINCVLVVGEYLDYSDPTGAEAQNPIVFVIPVLHHPEIEGLLPC
jgi:hypothetical protein